MYNPRNCSTFFIFRFKDVVDILVGWHIDSSQKLSVRLYTSKVLLDWHKFWVIDMDFSSDLLKNFMEDLGEDIGTLRTAHKNNYKSKQTADEIKECLGHILAVLQVFNTVMSCLRIPTSTNSKESRSMEAGKTKKTNKALLGDESMEWFDIAIDCLFLVSGIDEEEANYENNPGNDCGRFDEDLMITGQHTILMLLEMCPEPTTASKSTNDTPSQSLYLQKHHRLLQLLGYCLSRFTGFSRQGQICVLRFTLQILNLATECGIEGQTHEEKVVQLLSKANIVEKSAISSNYQV